MRFAIALSGACLWVPTFVCPPSGDGPLVTTALADGLYTGHTEGVLNMREGKVTRLLAEATAEHWPVMRLNRRR